MARLDVSGIEKELADFLDGHDLKIRASAELTSQYVETVVGGESGCTTADVFKQHGGQVIELADKKHLRIPVSTDIGEILLSTSKDAVTDFRSEEVKNPKNEVRIYANVAVCFVYEK